MFMKVDCKPKTALYVEDCTCYILMLITLLAWQMPYPCVLHNNAFSLSILSTQLLPMISSLPFQYVLLSEVSKRLSRDFKLCKFIRLVCCTPFHCKKCIPLQVWALQVQLYLSRNWFHFNQHWATLRCNALHCCKILGITTCSSLPCLKFRCCSVGTGRRIDVVYVQLMPIWKDFRIAHW